MSLTRAFWAFALAAGLSMSAIEAKADEQPQQRYSAWQAHPTAGYWYATYHYKPSPSATDYHHHYVIWNPKHPDYCFCYNPATKVYYGRWDRSACGKQQCHLGKNPHGYYAIAKAEQKGAIGAIPETAFSARTEAPQIPTDAGNPTPAAAPAGNPPAAGGDNPPATPPATNPPAANPPAGNTPPAAPPATPANPDAPPATPAGTDAPATDAPAAANTNPQIEPPPDLPQEALPTDGQ